MLDLLAQTMPGMPVEIWWLAPAVLVLLGVAAGIDAFTARVPDPVIFLGLFVTTAAQGFATDWPIAARHLTIGFGAGFSIYALNQLWYRLKKSDALGMGDAKWTMLAVTCFGIAPAAIAWGLGAWLALSWMGLRRLAKKPMARVHFAPFLFAGLLAGIWWLRLR
jgi:prepilin signal peptidase PulO-like enzyme (type II secretory pathway)